ncbi:MAG: CPBP family intramembrane metalloprotease [Prevotellaceae bacterium]|nr:CPBP family intramembrane metalloprotease [Prevotellaceae bacterium]
MDKYPFVRKLAIANPFMQLVLLMCALAVGMLLVGSAGVALASVFGVSPSQVQEGLSLSNPSATRYLMAVQSVGIFLLPPLLAAFLIYRRRACIFLGVVRRPMSASVLLTVAALVAVIPFISFAANANALLPLPEWAKSADHAATKLTTELMFTTSAATMLLNLLVFALMPAVCEEFLFRGYLQRVLCAWTKNPHAAILASAVAFSALHFQFEGFIPRLLLGALFGYLLYWSGSLWLSVAAHFTNNAVAVCVYFYAARRGIVLDLDSPEIGESTGALVALVSALVVLNLLGMIRRREKFRRLRRLNPT